MDPLSTSGPLSETLRACAAGRLSGVLRVLGEPGGAIHLAGGGVTAISTPGAPDAEGILLRSGRVPETGWSAAFAAAAPDGPLAAELIRRELVGTGALEALLRTALADAMFVIAAGKVDECRMEHVAIGAVLPLEPGAEPDDLLAEAARRIQVLESLAHRIAHDRDRVAAAAATRTPGVAAGDGQAEILALANGRRTARDMAFVLGRGVYAVALEIARMRAAGLLIIESSRAATGPPEPAAPPVTEPDAAVPGAAGLPRRRRGSASKPDGQQAAPRPAERVSVLRLLRPGAGAHRQPGKETQ
jgi:hypothetical protein